MSFSPLTHRHAPVFFYMKIIEKALLIIALALSCIAAVMINIAVFMIEESIEIPLDMITVTATDSAADYSAANVFDDDNSTIWHTTWTPVSAPMPQSLIFEFSGTVKLSEIDVLPRQDIENGRITEYNIYVKNDGEFVQVIGDGRWDYSDGIGYKTAALDPPVIAGVVKFEVISGINGFASAAEFRFKGVMTGGSETLIPSDTDLPYSDIYFTPADRTLLGVFADDEHRDYPGRNIFDNNTGTFWHTDWETGDMTFPHRLYINLGGEHTVIGLRFIDRQDGSPNGNINKCTLYSDNGLECSDITPENTGFEKYRTIPLINPIKTTVLVIEVTGAQGEFASMSELSILAEDGVITPCDAFGN